MNWQFTIEQWFVLAFWILAAVAIILGIAISAEDWITERFGGHNGQNHR